MPARTRFSPARHGKRLLLTRVKEPVRELLARWSPEGVGADDRMFWSVADAAQAHR